MKLLIDSDFLVGLFRDGDPHHTSTTKTFRNLRKQKENIFVLNLVLYETATVLSHRVGMEAVRLFYAKFPLLDLTTLSVEAALEEETWKIFLRQTKKGCSFVDCGNLAIVQHYKLDGILSFDTFYPKNLRVGVSS